MVYSLFVCVADLKIKESWHTVEATLGGALGPIVEAMQAAANAGDEAVIE